MAKSQATDFDPISVIDPSKISEMVEEHRPENSYTGCLWRAKNLEKICSATDLELKDSILALEDLNLSIKSQALGKITGQLSEFTRSKKYQKIAENLDGLKSDAKSLFNSTEFYKMYGLKLKYYLDKQESKVADDYNAFCTLIERIEKENERLHNSLQMLTKQSLEWENTRGRFEKREKEHYQEIFAKQVELREKNQEIASLESQIKEFGEAQKLQTLKISNFELECQLHTQVIQDQELSKSEYDTSKQIAMDRAEGLGIYAELMIEQDMNKKLSNQIKDQETLLEMLAKNFASESRLVGDLKSEIDQLNEQLKFKEQTFQNNRTTMGALQNALANESYECGFQLDSSWIDRETTRKSRFTNNQSPTSRKSYNRQLSRFNTFVSKYNEMGTKDLKNEVAKRMTTNINMFNSTVSTGFTTHNVESGLNTLIEPKARGNNRLQTNIAIPKGPGQPMGVGRMSQSNTVWAGRPSFNIGAVDAKLAGQKAELGWSNADTFGDRQQTMEFGRLTRGNKDG
jgi:hypothetical protein